MSKVSYHHTIPLYIPIVPSYHIMRYQTIALFGPESLSQLLHIVSVSGLTRNAGLLLPESSACSSLSSSGNAGVPSSAPMAAMGSGDGVIHGEGPGVLEIKCPFNKGDPNSAAPPKLAQWYYMPQVNPLTLLTHPHVFRGQTTRQVRQTCLHIEEVEQTLVLTHMQRYIATHSIQDRTSGMHSDTND